VLDHKVEDAEPDTELLEDYFTLLTTDAEYAAADPEAYRNIQRFIYGWRARFPKWFALSQAVPKYLERMRGETFGFGFALRGGLLLPKPFRKKQSDIDDLFLFRREVGGEEVS
jgi:hypothetical protein